MKSRVYASTSIFSVEVSRHLFQLIYNIQGGTPTMFGVLRGYLRLIGAFARLRAGKRYYLHIRIRRLNVSRQVNQILRYLEPMKPQWAALTRGFAPPPWRHERSRFHDEQNETEIWAFSIIRGLSVPEILSTSSSHRRRSDQFPSHLTLCITSCLRRLIFHPNHHPFPS